MSTRNVGPGGDALTQDATTGHSVLLVPVAEVEPVVRRQITANAPEFLLCHGSRAVHAHITLLGPFADVTSIDEHLIGELGEFFAAVEPFEFTLLGPLPWRDWLAYLRPEPSAPFRDLTLGLCDRYPAFPPYGGAYNGLSPHLTLGALTTGQTLRRFADELAGIVPPRLIATEAQLHWYQPGKSLVLARFPFRGSPAVR